MKGGWKNVSHEPLPKGNHSAKEEIRVHSKPSALIAICLKVTEHTALSVASVPILCITSSQRVEFQSICVSENADEGNVSSHVYIHCASRLIVLCDIACG